jgi:hypothetical protein
MLMRQAFGRAVVLAALAAATLGLAAETGKAVYVESSRAKYEDVAPGVVRSTLRGDAATGPYAAFTRFAPDIQHALHRHPSEIRIVVIRGA